MSSILKAPSLPSIIPNSAQWLAGQGAGSWFWLDVTETENLFRIRRFSPIGILECDLVFKCNEMGFIYSKPFEFTYLSHCSFCTIYQNNQKFTFSLFKD